MDMYTAILLNGLQLKKKNMLHRVTASKQKNVVVASYELLLKK